MGGELGPHHDAKSAAALRDQVLGIYRTPRECKGSEKRHARRCQALGRGPHTQGPRRSLRSGHRGGGGGLRPPLRPSPPRSRDTASRRGADWMDGWTRPLWTSRFCMRGRTRSGRERPALSVPLAHCHPLRHGQWWWCRAL
jgi:hypothetical protein